MSDPTSRQPGPAPYPASAGGTVTVPAPSPDRATPADEGQQTGASRPARVTPGNGLAAAGLVLGLLGLGGAFVPALNVEGIILGVLGAILASLALARSTRLAVAGRGLAVTGIAVGAVAAIIGVVINVVFVGAVDDAVGEGTASTVTSASRSAGAAALLPLDASGLLGGTAEPTLDAGEPGKVSVVQVGTLDKAAGTLVFAFRNNTDRAVSSIEWSATASSKGSPVASGRSQGTTPTEVQPGGVGLAYIHFDDAGSVPSDAEYELTVTSEEAGTEPFGAAQLKVTEANLVNGAVVGSATNDTGSDATAPYDVSVYCFDADTLLSATLGHADQNNDIVQGAKATFSVDLGGASCPTYVVGVSGWSM